MVPEAQNVSETCPTAHDKRVTEQDLPFSSYKSLPVFSEMGGPMFGSRLGDFLSRACEGSRSLELDLPLLHAWKPGTSWFSAEAPWNSGEWKTDTRDSRNPLVSSVQCSRNCSGGFQIREIQCVDSLDRRSLRPFHCQFLAGIRPPLSVSCNVEPCEEWQVEPWNQVRPPHTSSPAPASISLCITL